MGKNIIEKIENPVTTKDKIINYLFEEERDLAWLNRKTDIPYGTLYGIFVQGTMSLNPERLNLINIALDTKFELEPVPAEQTNA